MAIASVGLVQNGFLKSGKPLLKPFNAKSPFHIRRAAAHYHSKARPTVKKSTGACFPLINDAGHGGGEEPCQYYPPIASYQGFN
jgi:hypothetical protein